MNIDRYHISRPGSSHPYEDRVLVNDDKRLYAVADGVTMSSQGSGAIAAELALNLLSREFSSNLVKAIEAVHDSLVKMKISDKTIGETTLTAVHLTDERLEVANVGDSPAFLIRDEGLSQLTVEDKGFFGYLTQVLGYPSEIRVHHLEINIRSNDYVIVATDGLSHVLNNYVLTKLARTGLSAKDFATSLMHTAENYPASYDDDKSVIIIKVL